MEPINNEKIQALRKHNHLQVSKPLRIYPLVALTCCLFCTIPFWFPYLYSSTNTLFCNYIPRLLPLFFNAKYLFIIGNLIVIFLVRDSKVQPSKTLESSTKVKMYAVFSSKNRKVVSKRQFERTISNDLSLEAKSDRVGYLEEEALVTQGDELREEKELPLLHYYTRIFSTEGDIAQTNADKRERLTNRNEDVNKIPALSTEELKRRADDFIERVNKQIRLEANEVLV